MYVRNYKVEDSKEMVVRDSIWEVSSAPTLSGQRPCEFLMRTSWNPSYYQPQPVCSGSAPDGEDGDEDGGGGESRQSGRRFV